MFSKYFLLNKIVNFLIKKEYAVLLSSGCFDIAAKKEESLLIKTLVNIDALQQKQALSLRAIAHFLSAFPFIISLKSNRGFLDENIIYSRFSLPVLTPRLFESILEGNAFAAKSIKGKYVVEIDAELMRKRRKEFGFSLSELAKKINITKKALYEIENKRVNPCVETVEKIEKVLKVNLRLPYEMSYCEVAYLKPKDKFQRIVCNEFLRIGLDNSAIYSAPFEIVGREEFSIISGISKNMEKIDRKVELIKKLSSFFSTRAVFITKKSKKESIEGIPIFLESELKEIENVKEFDKFMKEKI